MVVDVVLFAGLRERAGAASFSVSLPEPATVADLRVALAATPLGAVAQGACMVAVNAEYAREDVAIRPGDEVALIPPVSGGAPEPRVVRRAEVTSEPLDPAALLDLVRDPRAGAVVLFEGATREVEHLDYEAYRPMAEQLIERIAGEEAERHGLVAVAVVHRVGRVALSEPSILVAAAAPHRAEAFAGARAVLDAVKARAPIFKREAGRWVEGALPSPD